MTRNGAGKTRNSLTNYIGETGIVVAVTSTMPKSPKKTPPPRRKQHNPDKGVGDQLVEDFVGRRPDEKPDLVPPGTDPEAIEADRATARRSDRTDARDGVDPSDTVSGGS